jgi:molybdopterin-guanine dinucleotide biosynthesis protein A
VVAGGESRRLGRDKALLPLPDGRVLLERTIDTLRAAGLEHIAVSVTTAERGAALLAAINHGANIGAIVDAAPGMGPLGGLHAALTAFPDCHLLLVACDLPHLETAAVRAVLDEPRDADILVPRTANRDQPLHALYAPACREVVARLIAEGRLAMRDLLAVRDLRVRVLGDTWLERHAISAAGFDNVNTPDDLARVVGGHALRRD